MKHRKHQSVAVIILNWNRLDETRRCLKSIRALEQQRYAIEVIVVDNASLTDPTKKIKHTAQRATVLRLKENRGFTGGNNVGIKQALQGQVDWVWLVNNDTVIAPDSLTLLLRTADANPDCKLLSPAIYCLDNAGTQTNQLQFNGGVIDWLRATGRSIIQPRPVRTGRQLVVSNFLPGTALLIHRSVIETVGLLDDRFFAYNEDTDYSIRATKAGITLGVVPEAKVWHELARSTGVKSPLFWYLNSRNKWLFMKLHSPLSKWPGFLSYYFFVKPVTYRALACLGRPSSENIRALQATVRGTLDGLLGRFGQPR